MRKIGKFVYKNDEVYSIAVNRRLLPEVEFRELLPLPILLPGFVVYETALNEFKKLFNYSLPSVEPCIRYIN